MVEGGGGGGECVLLRICNVLMFIDMQFYWLKRYAK